jgi:hypothetical protein
MSSILPCRAKSFKLNAPPQLCNAIVRAVLQYVPVLVLSDVEVSEDHALPYLSQEELADRLQSVRVHSIDPELIGCTVRLSCANKGSKELTVTTKDLDVFDAKGMPLPSVFPPHEVRLGDGTVHQCFNVLCALQPGESVKLQCRIARAVTGDSGKYRMAPILALAQVRDNRAAQEAYLAEVPEAERSEETRRNFDACRANAFGVQDEFVLTVGVEHNAYTSDSLLVTACHCLVDRLSATSAVVQKQPSSSAGDVSLKNADDTIGGILAVQLLQNVDVVQATYKRDGNLRVAMKAADHSIVHAVTDAAEKLKAFYLKIAEGHGHAVMHPRLQAVMTEFKRQSVPEKRRRLIDIGCNKTIVETSDEGNLDNLARIYLHETERFATPSLLHVPDEKPAADEKPKAAVNKPEQDDASGADREEAEDITPGTVEDPTVPKEAEPKEASASEVPKKKRAAKKAAK